MTAMDIIQKNEGTLDAVCRYSATFFKIRFFALLHALALSGVGRHTRSCSWMCSCALGCVDCGMEDHQ